MISIQDWGRIAVATRLSGHTSPTFVDCWGQLTWRGLRDGDHLMPCAIRFAQHRAANRIVSAFLETDCDSLLFVDNDHTFKPDVLERLRSNPLGWEYDAIGALYVARGTPYPIILREDPECADAEPGTGSITYDWINRWPWGDTMDVDALGLGFTLVRRRVFETLSEPWFMFDQVDPDATEDMIFFARAKRAGFRFAVDTEVHIGHLMDNACLTMPEGYDDAIAEYRAQAAAEAAA